MNVIVKLPVEIPEETINELAKRAAEELVNDERDLVAVVRCKDCRHCKNLYCYLMGFEAKDEDFCSYGKERDGK